LGRFTSGTFTSPSPVPSAPATEMSDPGGGL
jgi:hypothetical protein